MTTTEIKTQLSKNARHVLLGEGCWGRPSDDHLTPPTQTPRPSACTMRRR